MIQDACKRGQKRFHLGRSSTDSGGETFKKKWNARPTQLYWYQWRSGDHNTPELRADNPRFQLAIKLWRHLPVPITTTIGPFIAKNIP
jgi:hypothetical protein